METIRTLELTFTPTIDWDIVDRKLYAKNLPYVGLFAKGSTFKNKIVYLFDISFVYLEKARRDKRYYEVCNFKHIDENSGEVVKQFQGTFIDALEYIEANFYQE